MTDSITNTGDQLPQRMAVAADLQLSAPTPRAAQRVLEFFIAQNEQRPRPQGLPERDTPVRRLVCEAHGLHQLTGVQSFHVAAFVTVRADS